MGEREREVRAADEAGTAALLGLAPSDYAAAPASSTGSGTHVEKVDVTPCNLHSVIRSVAKQGQAAKIAYNARSLRAELEADFTGSVELLANERRQSADQAAAMAVAAAERVATLDAQAA